MVVIPRLLLSTSRIHWIAHFSNDNVCVRACRACVSHHNRPPTLIKCNFCFKNRFDLAAVIKCCGEIHLS